MSTPELRNPYTAPRARLHDGIGLRTRMYSPTQVALGTLLGGTAGLIYFLRANFVALGNAQAARNTILVGAALFVVLFGMAFALPAQSSIGMLAVQVGLARWIAERYQMTKEAIAASADHEFHSGWRVFWIGLVCLAIGFAAVYAVTLTLMLMSV